MKMKWANTLMAVLLIISIAILIWMHNPVYIVKVTDETWLTRRHLSEMACAIIRYYDISDAAERNALRNVRTLDELWSLLQEKIDVVQPIVPAPVEEGFMRDAWGKPYVLETTKKDLETVIRITSKSVDGIAGNHAAGEQYIEIVFDNLTIHERHSWEPIDR